MVRLERDGRIGVIVIDNPPVNAGSQAVRAGILDTIAAFKSDPELDAAVLIGAGKTFVAGSDIREFGQPIADPHLPVVIAAIEACPKPVIAALHGAALGGGLELALGCDARIAAPGTVLGLPEVKLGMIPGAGGTQRLPRLVGIAAAIEIITSARRLPAPEALQLGLVDAVADGDLRTAAVALAHSWTGRKRRLGGVNVPPGSEDQIEAAAAAALKKSRGRPAVEQAIAAIRAAATMSFAPALVQERQIFQRLREGEEALALRHLFFAERDAAKIVGLEGVKSRPVALVGIVGAGRMGIAIAQAFADAGIPVLLTEKDRATLDTAMAQTQQNYQRQVASGRLAPDLADRRLALIVPQLNTAALAEADLLIEAVFEDMATKQDLLRRLDEIAKPGAILASNTSYLDLDSLAAATGRPADIVGLHFFAPANVMRLLEVVRGAQTAPDVLATALATGKRIGKVCVVAGVGEGFIGNRLYSAYRNQCEFMVEEGAWPEEVDAALEGFGFALGPFAVTDLSGLDIAWHTRQRLAAARDPRARYVDILDRLCERGHFGQKAGKGWYEYRTGARRGVPYEEARQLIEQASATKGIIRRAFSADEIVARALAAMVNEAAWVLSEGIAQRASDIDLAMVHGFGFPDYRGGPLFWARRQSRGDIEKALAKVQEATGFGFRRADVAKILDAMAQG